MSSVEHYVQLTFSVVRNWLARTDIPCFVYLSSFVVDVSQDKKSKRNVSRQGINGRPISGLSPKYDHTLLHDAFQNVVRTPSSKPYLLLNTTSLNGVKASKDTASAPG